MNCWIHIGRILVVMLVMTIVAAWEVHGQFEPIDPRHPDFKYFEESGRMIGSIDTTAGGGITEMFGRNLYPIGDYNRDGRADFITQHYRPDIASPAPLELLLFSGVADTVPIASSGVRIGPSEALSETSYLCSGDFDADGWLDIVVAYELQGDTSFGNHGGFTMKYLTVFWGNDSGNYSVGDTSRLPCDTEVWVGLPDGASIDINNDKIDDLVVTSYTARGFDHGELIPTAKIQGFIGEKGRRWGREETERTAALKWWTPESATRLQVLDHDGDGVKDLILRRPSGQPEYVTILYCDSTGNLPDTNRAEFISTINIYGRSSMFCDVTGDGIPELIVLVYDGGHDGRVKIYAGRRGQRLIDQYGNGDSDPIDGKGWWRRPWAEIITPREINSDWGHSGVLYNLGDGNLDGIDDVWLYSWPFLLCYTTGATLDSLIDGMFRTPDIVATHYSEAPSNLGSIDGGDLPSIGVYYDGRNFPGGIIFFKPRADLPTYSRTRRDLPHIEPVVGIERTQEAHGNRQINARLVPNPATGRIQISFDEPKTHQQYVIEVVDVRGAVHARQDLTPVNQWISPILPSGTYWVSISSEAESITLQAVVR